MGWRLLAFLLVAAPAAAPAAPVTIAARDGVALAGDVHGPSGAGAGVLLLHQCNMDRRSWSALVPKLTAAGLTVLTYDRRGKGGSAFGGDAFPHHGEDSKAALAHLRGLLAPNARLAMVGASCGGNQAFLTAPEHPDVAALVILSSPLSDAEPAWAELRRRSDIAVLGIGATGDGQTVAHARRAVASSASPDSWLIAYDGALHGVPLFDQDTRLPETIAEWVAARLAQR